MTITTTNTACTTDVPTIDEMLALLRSFGPAPTRYVIVCHRQDRAELESVFKDEHAPTHEYAGFSGIPVAFYGTDAELAEIAKMVVGGRYEALVVNGRDEERLRALIVAAKCL